MIEVPTDEEVLGSGAVVDEEGGACDRLELL